MTEQIRLKCWKSEVSILEFELHSHKTKSWWLHGCGYIGEIRPHLKISPHITALSVCTPTGVPVLEPNKPCPHISPYMVFNSSALCHPFTCWVEVKKQSLDMCINDGRET